MSKKSSSRPSHEEYWVHPDMNKVIETSLYYGFTPTEEPRIEKQDRDQSKGIQTDDGCTCIHPEEKIALLRTHFGKNQPQLPVMIAYERSHKTDPKKVEYSLDIIGTPRSIADATVIKAAYVIAQAEELGTMWVEINSVGDRDSLNRFTRELNAYFRKHINELDPECRQLFKKSPFLALQNCDHEKCKEIKAHAPHAMNFLSEPSRTHFMEVLELLEMTGIPYSINNALIEHIDVASHVLFRIMGQEEEKKDPVILASGIRWSGLGKKMGLKKDVPSVSATIYLRKQTKIDLKTKKIKKPQFYFIQMGQEAKLKSLVLIENLRQAKIPVYHSLTKDKLTAQLSSAEFLKVPYILIIGQKESMDNTVLVREMNNRSQETIRMERVAEYLKQLLK